jgi:hypothetical protein
MNDDWMKQARNLSNSYMERRIWSSHKDHKDHKDHKVSYSGVSLPDVGPPPSTLKLLNESER